MVFAGNYAPLSYPSSFARAGLAGFNKGLANILSPQISQSLGDGQGVKGITVDS